MKFFPHNQLDNFINTDRVKMALHSFANDKSPGPDRVKAIVIKNFGTKTVEAVTQIFKACYELGYTPEIWREARAVFVPKPGMGSYNSPRSFRPICLTSFFTKSLEKIVDWELSENIDPLHPVSNQQHAYRLGRSTESALSEVVAGIEDGFNNKLFL